MRPLFILACLSSSAAAQPGLVEAPPPKPDVGYVHVGGMLGLDHFINAAFVGEAGVRLGSLPLLVHGATTLGGSGDVEGGGSLRRYRAGIDARACDDDGTWCVWAGLEIGWQSQEWDNSDEDPVEHHHGRLAGGRIGADGGGPRWRWRLTMDFYNYHRVSDLMGDEKDINTGFSIETGLVRRF